MDVAASAGTGAVGAGSGATIGGPAGASGAPHSRTGSISLEGAPLYSPDQQSDDGAGERHHLFGIHHGHHSHHQQHHFNPEEKSLASLARRNTKRNKTVRNKKVLELQDVMGIASRRASIESVDQQHLHLQGFAHPNAHRRSPSIRRGNSPSLQRSPSPRHRYSHHLHHDIGFSDTVSNVVEIVKHEHHRSSRKYGGFGGEFLGSWSASTSPARSPSPVRMRGEERERLERRQQQRSQRRGYGYGGLSGIGGGGGTTSLEQRSRSPSPTHHQHHTAHHHPPPPSAHYHHHNHHHVPYHQHGPPVIACAVVGLPMQPGQLPPGIGTGGARVAGRRLPPTPCKPSTLQLRPGPINFPKLNASPTHVHTHSAHATPHSLPPHHSGYRVVGGGSSGGGGQERGSMSLPRDVSAAAMHAAAADDSQMGTAASSHQQQPLSFEQAVALGRGGGRMLPSPVPNGYKPKGGPSSSGREGRQSPRHSDSDDDDWC